jgi:DNA polymerase III subunit epsilon
MVDLLDRPIAEIPLVFFDLETTGLSFRRGARVCEVAMLRREPALAGGDEAALYESLIDPGRPISLGAFRVNRISHSLLKGAPRFGELAPQIRQVMAGAMGVAHNAPFDTGFLRTEFLYLGQAFLVPHCLDTLAIARGFYRFPKNNLSEIARAFGIRVELAHRARADVETTRAVFDAMVRDLAAKGICTARQIQQQLKRAARRKRKRAEEYLQPALGGAIQPAPPSALATVPQGAT